MITANLSTLACADVGSTSQALAHNITATKRIILRCSLQSTRVDVTPRRHRQAPSLLECSSERLELEALLTGQRVHALRALCVVELDAELKRHVAPGAQQDRLLTLEVEDARSARILVEQREVAFTIARIGEAQEIVRSLPGTLARRLEVRLCGRRLVDSEAKVGGELALYFHILDPNLAFARDPECQRGNDKVPMVRLLDLDAARDREQRLAVKRGDT